MLLWGLWSASFERDKGRGRTREESGMVVYKRDDCALDGEMIRRRMINTRIFTLYGGFSRFLMEIGKQDISQLHKAVLVLLSYFC